MHKNINIFIKATIKSIIVAFIYVIIICSLVYLIFGKSISKAVNLIDVISVETTNKQLENVKLDLETKNLKIYPEYGTKYATLKIPSLDIDLPLYFGDTLSILKNGVGHSSGSYFPGEGGSILCMAHNSINMFRKLPEIEIGAQIVIETSYGQYIYEVYKTDIVHQNNLDAAPIQREKEILMLYTCYPINGIGLPKDRFFAYANLINEQLY